MTSISPLPAARHTALDERTSAALAEAAAAAASGAAQQATTGTPQDASPIVDKDADAAADLRAAAHQSIDQRIDALVDRQGGHHAISADQAGELKQLLGGPASADQDPAEGDAAATATTSTSFGDQLDALSKSLHKLRTSLTRHAYGVGGTAGEGGLVFDRLA